jgi:hypothetical protein
MQELDGVRYYEKSQHGYFVSGTHGRLHRRVYSKTYGNIPHGWEVHHLDGDRSNNAIENLVCMSGYAHRMEHRVPITVTCVQCGTDYDCFVNPGHGNKYCSSSCSNKAWRKRHADVCAA